MKPTVLRVPVHSLRRIETPYEKELGYRNFLAVVDARHLPDLSSWRKINVRDAKLRGRVPNAIRKTFQEQPEGFLFMNRGLTLAADKVEYQEGDGRKMMLLSMRDPEVHGLLDGGHTNRVVQEALAGFDEKEQPRFLRVEILTGFDRETIGDLVEARNTSNQVRDESLANLRNEFDPIKDTLRKQPYFTSIAWTEYEEFSDTNKPKPIDVRDIISYLVAFDTAEFDTLKHPLITYKDKRACLRHYLDNQKRLHEYLPLLPDILTLWDDIHAGWADWYKASRKDEGLSSGKPSLLTGMVQTSNTLYFRGGEVPLRIPEAYRYPLLAAFRAAAKKKKGREAAWSANPGELLPVVGPRLVGAVGAAARQYLNPNKVGKDLAVWSSCFLVVESALRSSVAEEKDRRIRELEAQLQAMRRPPKGAGA